MTDNSVSAFAYFAKDNDSPMALNASMLTMAISPERYQPTADDLETPFPESGLQRPPIYDQAVGNLRYERCTVNQPLLWGYFTGPQPSPSYCWRMMRDDTVWMAYSPIELESLSPSLWAARGKVLILGAGMGALAYSVRQKPDVESVTVVDNDSNVINCLTASGALNGCDVICADALKLHADPGTFDVVLVDIWPDFGSERMAYDLQMIHTNLGSQSGPDVYVPWGVEHSFTKWLISHTNRHDDPGEAFRGLLRQHGDELWRTYTRHMGNVPLFDPSEHCMQTTGKPWVHWCIKAVMRGFEQEGWLKAWATLKSLQEVI